jgi:archaellum component FlaC
MTTVDELAIEVINAKEQLKNINNTINRDRAVAKELEEDIKAKKAEQKDLGKKLDEINSQINNVEANKKEAERLY